jgi:hypothetical protein
MGARWNCCWRQALEQAQLAPYAPDLAAAWTHIAAAARAAWATGNPAEALANAVPFMQAFGHGVLAWIWLDVALAALVSDPDAGRAATSGTLAATRFFYHYELPKTGAWLRVVETRDMTCANLPEEAF